MAKAGKAWVPASSSRSSAANRNAYVATDRRDFRLLLLLLLLLEDDEEEEGEEVVVDEGEGEAPGCWAGLGSSRRSCEAKALKVTVGPAM